jgi:hypothetical protein
MCGGIFTTCKAKTELKKVMTIAQFNETNEKYAKCKINKKSTFGPRGREYLRKRVFMTLFIRCNDVALYLYDIGYYTPTKLDIGMLIKGMLVKGMLVKGNTTNINALIIKVIGTDNIFAIQYYRSRALDVLFRYDYILLDD